jgi:hypothetical protein
MIIKESGVQGIRVAGLMTVKQQRIRCPGIAV